jgi:acyl-CoA synthetase (AMP-forming)/AMP-acid ligase II
MLVPPGADFLALTIAIAGRGATPVFVDPGIGLERLTKCIEDTAPHVFIGSPKAHILRHLKRSLFHRLKFYVTAAEWAFSRGKSLGHFKRFANAPLAPVPLPVMQRDGELTANNAALIAFTSGATGVPKGVVFTNEMLEAELGLIRDVLGQQTGGRDLTLLPIFSLFNVALGVASIFPSMPVGKPLALDPAQVVKLVHDLSIDSSFGSPTLWNKIAEYAFRTGATLPTLRRVFMAGAAVSSSTIARVQSVLPNAVVSTPYGATESLPVTYISALELASIQRKQAVTGEQGTLVGKPVSGVRVRIIKSSIDAIPTLADAEQLPVGEIGEVIVSGENVSPEYLRRPDANRVGKILDGATFWHRMGDLGYLDSEGNLYYCGRKSHSVYTAERAFHSVPIEEIFNQLSKVKRSALIAVNSGREPAIVIEPLPEFWPESAEFEERFRSELRELALKSPLTASISTFFFHRSFPVDARHNAKIFREQLQDWAAKVQEQQKAA